MHHNEKKKVLLLGGGGFIGSALTPYLQSAGYDLKVVDLFWFGNNLPGNIETEKADNFNIALKDFEGFDAVVFLSGLSNDPMAEFSPKDNFIYNTGLPGYVGFMAREAGVKRFVYASSCSVYGYTRNRTFTEDDLAVCNYPYGASKLQGEQALLSLADENFSVVCLRQGTVCGYSPRMRLDLAINTMFKNAISLGKITLSNAKIWRPILGLKDLCQGYHKAIEADLQGGQIFNIASFNTTIGELSREVAEFVQERYGISVEITDNKVQDYRNYKVSTEKAHAMLGYEPKQDAIDILEELAANLESFKNFEDERFYNISVFKKLMLSRLIEN